MASRSNRDLPDDWREQVAGRVTRRLGCWLAFVVSAAPVKVWENKSLPGDYFKSKAHAEMRVPFFLRFYASSNSFRVVTCPSVNLDSVIERTLAAIGRLICLVAAAEIFLAVLALSVDPIVMCGWYGSSRLRCGARLPV